jgi:hypothetical protein
MTLFTISAAIIGVYVAAPLEDANAASNSCSHHTSDTSKKCSKNYTPLILDQRQQVQAVPLQAEVI